MDYKSLIVKELRGMMRDRQIPGRSRFTRKQDIIDRLIQDDQEAANDRLAASFIGSPPESPTAVPAPAPASSDAPQEPASEEKYLIWEELNDGTIWYWPDDISKICTTDLGNAARMNETEAKERSRIFRFLKTVRSGICTLNGELIETENFTGSPPKRPNAPAPDREPKPDKIVPFSPRPRRDRPAAKQKIITFSRTKDRLLLGDKTVTRRIWAKRTLLTWQKAWDEGRHCHRAYDKLPHHGGEQIGEIRLLQRPYLEKLSDLPLEDVAAEGYPELSRLEFIDRFFPGDGDRLLAVIRFVFTSDRVEVGETCTSPASVATQPESDRVFIKSEIIDLSEASDAASGQELTDHINDQNNPHGITPEAIDQGVVKKKVAIARDPPILTQLSLLPEIVPENEITDIDMFLSTLVKKKALSPAEKFSLEDYQRAAKKGIQMEYQRQRGIVDSSGIT